MLLGVAHVVQLERHEREMVVPPHIERPEPFHLVIELGGFLKRSLTLPGLVSPQPAPRFRP
jgi:hypothetical protein